jgi:hypothetical protein
MQQDMSAEKIELIAEVCHENNRAYCEAMYDHSQLPWNETPEWQKRSARQGVAFHLHGEYGPEALHENWATEKLLDGWVYGPVKDVNKKTHPCLVPYNELPSEQRAKDHLFVNMVSVLSKIL